MYASSIETSIHKFNVKANKLEFEEFSKYLDKCNENKVHENFFCYSDKFYNNYIIYYCSDAQLGKTLYHNFKTQKLEEDDGFVYNAFVKQEQVYKFVVNFHTSAATNAFTEFVKNLREENFLGYDKTIRNSVIFYALHSEYGYELSKKFENDYINSQVEIKTKIESTKIHPLDDEQKVYDLVEEKVESNDGKTINKIFSIFKNAMSSQ